MIRARASIVVALLGLGCQSGGAPGPGGGGGGAGAPEWLAGDATAGGGRVCAVGIAGRTHQMAKHKGLELSKERAVRNLAGVFETLIDDAGIEEATNSGTEIEYVRSVSVREELVEKVAAAADVEHWVDDGGAGPFEEKGYTYAQACVPASFLADARFDPSEIVARANAQKLTARTPPPWLGWVGSQKGARLCAVGFSLPALHPDSTFESVVEEVRGQLTEKSRTLVLSVADEFSVCRAGGKAKCDTIVKIVTAATNEAVSKGVLVNHFWYDRYGVGPNQRQRSTYGWGCTHPVGALTAAVQKVKEELPEVDVPATERVKMRAQDFFEELEREEAKAR